MEQTETERELKRSIPKRKRETDEESEECDTKIRALELPSEGFKSPKLDFPAIEEDPGSIKRKLEAIPMLDCNFCSSIAVAEELVEEPKEAAAEEKKEPAVKEKKEAIEEEDESQLSPMKIDSKDIRGAFMFGAGLRSKDDEEQSEEEYDDLFSMDEEEAGGEVLSAEILVLIATEQKHVFKTYRGLVDSGTSASLMDRSLVPNGEAKIKGEKCSRWKTQAGMFQTQGQVRLKKVKLPQFTTKRTFQANFNLFNRKDENQYRFILERDILRQLKLDARCAVQQQHI